MKILYHRDEPYTKGRDLDLCSRWRQGFKFVCYFNGQKLVALHFPLLSFLGASRDDSAVKVPLNPVLLEKQSSAISFSGLKANDANFCFLLSIQVIKPCAQLNSLYSATWGAPNVGPNELKMIISKRESDLIEILLWWTHFTFAISIFWYVTLTSWWW